MALIRISGKGEVRVPGIGPVKANALLHWRRSLESLFTSNIPQSLPPNQEAAIRAKYKNRLQQLNAQETTIRQDADHKRASTRSRYWQDRDGQKKKLQEIRVHAAQARADIDKRLSDEENELAKVRSQLSKTKQEVLAYRQVGLLAYMRSAVFLPQLKSI
jgi:5'-3' exonuclease